MKLPSVGLKDQQSSIPTSHFHFNLRGFLSNIKKVTGARLLSTPWQDFSETDHSLHWQCLLNLLYHVTQRRDQGRFLGFLFNIKEVTIARLLCAPSDHSHDWQCFFFISYTVSHREQNIVDSRDSFSKSWKSPWQDFFQHQSKTLHADDDHSHAWQNLLYLLHHITETTKLGTL